MTEKQSAHVEQALAERASTANEDQRRAADKRLAAAGHKVAAQRRAQAAEATGEPDGERKSPPKGRSTRQEAKGSAA